MRIGGQLVDPETTGASAPAAWRAAVDAALAQGWAFAGLYAAAPDALRAVLRRASEHRVLTWRSHERRAPTLTGLLAAAAWDEREAHDLHDWRFDGHDPLRPLVDHGGPTARWTPEVDGRDVHEVAVGPIHAGVIESGHFRFQVVGERILHLDARLFHKHRGLEAAAVGVPADEAIAYAQRACAADAVTNMVAYAQACETALGLWPDDELRRARTLLLELERLYNHLNDISAICAGVGFAPGTMLFAALKERAQRLNAGLAGHRFLFGSVALGRNELEVGAADARAARRELADLGDEFRRGWRELRFAGSLQDRLDGVGVVTRDDVLRLGGVGPAARATGLAVDARRAAPRLWYPDFTPASTEGGDVAGRLELRGEELATTFGLLDALLAEPVRRGAAEPEGGADPLGVATVESPRGATLCAVELDADRVERLHLRTGSYANWPLVTLAARGELLPDFPLINKSFELCYACVDR